MGSTGLRDGSVNVLEPDGEHDAAGKGDQGGVTKQDRATKRVPVPENRDQENHREHEHVSAKLRIIRDAPLAGPSILLAVVVRSEVNLRHAVENSMKFSSEQPGLEVLSLEALSPQFLGLARAPPKQGGLLALVHLSESHGQTAPAFDAETRKSLLSFAAGEFDRLTN